MPGPSALGRGMSPPCPRASPTTLRLRPGVYTVPDAGLDVHRPLVARLQITAPPKVRTWTPPQAFGVPKGVKTAEWRAILGEEAVVQFARAENAFAAAEGSKDTDSMW
eukprot:7216160-Alexandrium_andersonii.AAC.1